ncbi:hypothetical protein B7463_g6881, partial [Scytalidium lignicola]
MTHKTFRQERPWRVDSRVPTAAIEEDGHANGGIDADGDEGGDQGRQGGRVGAGGDIGKIGGGGIVSGGSYSRVFTALVLFWGEGRRLAEVKARSMSYEIIDPQAGFGQHHRGHGDVEEVIEQARRGEATKQREEVATDDGNSEQVRTMRTTITTMKKESRRREREGEVERTRVKN